MKSSTLGKKVKGKYIDEPDMAEEKKRRLAKFEKEEAARRARNQERFKQQRIQVEDGYREQSTFLTRF